MPRRADSAPVLRNPGNFRRALCHWFEKNGRDLPWRRTRDPYAIMVSEFMLQQTQVATVLPYYERWLARFPDFPALASASEAEVLHAWQGLGYYARARNLQATAKRITREFGGRLPRDLTFVRQLPGVGRYTAGAIASFAFDLPEPIVDANIARVLARLTDCRTPIDTAAGRSQLWQIAAALLPKTKARTYNSALMELGALVCTPRRPRCPVCPVRQLCRTEQPAALPAKKNQRAILRLTEQHGFIRDRQGVLLEQSHARWRGMWILPRLAQIPRRPPLLRLEFPFTHHRITLAVFAGSPPVVHNEHTRWFPLRALPQLAIPSPHRRALERLLATAN